MNMTGQVVLLFLGFISYGSCFFTQHAFSSHDCGDASTEVITVSKFDILPKPATLPGVLNITFAGAVKSQLGNDVSLNVTIERSILGFWTKLPCVQNVGSCFYDNPCHLVQAFADKGRKCPEALTSHGINCTCPVSPITLDIPYTAVNISSVPAALKLLIFGDFRLRVETTRAGQTIGCFTSTMTFKEKTDHSGFLFS